VKNLLDGVREPRRYVVTFNIGVISTDHWTEDLRVAGMWIIGEAHHFIDLLRHLVGQPIKDVQVFDMDYITGVEVKNDKVAISMGFADGSFGSVHYLANGYKAFPKERAEVFCGGRILGLGGCTS